MFNRLYQTQWQYFLIPTICLYLFFAMYHFYFSLFQTLPDVQECLNNEKYIFSSFLNLHSYNLQFDFSTWFYLCVDYQLPIDFFQPNTKSIWDQFSMVKFAKYHCTYNYLPPFLALTWMEITCLPRVFIINFHIM